MAQIPYISLESAFSLIDCQSAFSKLDKNQALYAYNFSKAAWNGAKICYFERSYESPGLLYIILRTFNVPSQQFYAQAKQAMDPSQVDKIYIYLASFLDNCGNYKSFGDSKFIPECSPDSFKKFFLVSSYWSQQQQLFEHIYSRIQPYIFSYLPPYSLINFSDLNGTSGYYSSNVTSQDAELIKNILIQKAVMSQNNRLIKKSPTNYLVKVAAEITKEESLQQDGITINFQYGQFSRFLSQLNKYLLEAQKYSANQTQMKMIDEYIYHFKTGNMDRHKESQKLWVEDKQPVIETNIGFIESYLDPLRIRAQFEGFVAVVNLEESELLTNLVLRAPIILQYLPWGKDFEVQQFKKPDFTSLQVLAFGSSGIPVGINIPNYHDIRENFGFKNVNLGNAYGTPTAKSIQYAPLNEIELHLKHYKASLFVIVALHELLGHGSGRLLNSIPSFNSPLNNGPITTCYKQNQNFHSVFGEIASTYEECKADCVALFLSTFEDVQEVLLPKASCQERWDIVFCGWFDLIMGGLKGMQYYDVDSKKWLQAHIGASFAILQVLRQKGGIFSIKKVERQGKPYLQIHLNRNTIKLQGREAMGNFLKHLQVYKSTADAQAGIKYFTKYLEMDEQLLEYRKIVMANKRPRRITVQPVVECVNGVPKYVKYPPNVFGCIDSHLIHYGQNPEYILEEWEQNNQEFKY